MFERTDVYPDRRLSSFCWMLDILQPLAGEAKEGQTESEPAITKGCLEEPIGSVRVTHDSSDKRHRRRT